MARPRPRKNPRRRRKDNEKKKLLRDLCAAVDQQDAQNDGTGSAATALPSNKDASGPETASTADQKTPASESKQRGKPRRVPDRHYYHRPDKMERQYLGLQRRITSAVDDKIAQGSAALDKWKRDASVFMDKFKRKVERELEMMKRDLDRVRDFHGVRLRFLENGVDRLNNTAREVREQCDKLKNRAKGTG